MASILNTERNIMYYIYNTETMKLVAEIDTDDFSDFEFDYDWDLCGATQSPAFGYDGGVEK